MKNWKIYIHGRPKGQDVWPSTDGNVNESLYLSSFLDSNIGSDVKSMMSIDTFDNSTYYTYVHRCNIDEYEHSREKSYFAITVCLRGLYATDVTKMFNLLDLIYNQKCLNLILKEENNGEVYLVERFDSIENNLIDISNIIEQNLDKVLSSSFASLTTDCNTKYSNVKYYAITDVNSPAFFLATQNQTVVVSPYYMTKEDDENKIRNEKAKVEKELRRTKNQCSEYQKKIDTLEEELTRWTAKAESKPKIPTSQPSQSGEVLSLREENIQLKDEIARLKNIKKTQNTNSEALASGKLRKSLFPEWLTLFNSIVLIMCLWGIYRTPSINHDEGGNMSAQGERQNTNQAQTNSDNGLDYLVAKERFREAQMSTNQNIDIVNGSTNLRTNTEYKIQLADSTLVEDGLLANCKWVAIGNAKMKGDTISTKEKGRAEIYLKYNKIIVLRRKVEIN